MLPKQTFDCFERTATTNIGRRWQVAPAGPTGYLMGHEKFNVVANMWADLAPALLGTALCIGFFALLGIMIFHPVPREDNDPLMILLGELAGAFTTVVAFYYGSSTGSKWKDDTINRLVGPK